MERTWAGLQKMSRDQLIAEYDRESQSVGVWGVGFIRDEIFQRDREAEGDRMESMTREIRTLTRWITVLTVVNTAAVIIALILH